MQATECTNGTWETKMLHEKEFLGNFDVFAFQRLSIFIFDFQFTEKFVGEMKRSTGDLSVCKKK